MAKIGTNILTIILLAVTLLLMGCFRSVASDIPVGEMAYQEWWVARASLLFAVTVGLILCVKLFYKTNKLIEFYQTVTLTMILLAGLEAISGLCQLYGFAVSHHSLYAMTGSFFNPGPYSGYLAMVFPLCLHEWLKRREEPSWKLMQQIAYYGVLGVLLLILCVFPAGMSRSAWVAAVVSGLWVYSMHTPLYPVCRKVWRQHRNKFIACASGLLVCLILSGIFLFHLKKDSANGRLFMWKISCLAIGEQPLTGHGTGHFAEAYGKAQEEYFAQGIYSAQEELVAGSPEYAFNEYLQVAVEWGIPVLIAILIVIVFCLWRGIRLKRFGICGAIISLMVFAFSSYPMQIPAFFVSLFFLLAAAVINRPRELLFFALFIGLWGIYLWRTNRYEACKEWSRAQVLYHCNAYKEAADGYAKLYPALNTLGAFLFEYGHCLHKMKEYETSNKILKEATIRSCDPMILNIIGKNYQGMGQYNEAEAWLVRSTNRLPGRIYPYYLLAKLYAEPAYSQPEKMKQAAEVVLTKEPKVQSTAIQEMRREMQKILGNK